jgi:hypothetical protein
MLWLLSYCGRCHRHVRASKDVPRRQKNGVLKKHPHAFDQAAPIRRSIARADQIVAPVLPVVAQEAVSRLD